MRVLRVTVSRKEYAEITVTVPDGTEPLSLMRHPWRKEIVRAVKELDPLWQDEPDEDPEVEQVSLLEGDEAAKELEDYRHAELVPPVERQPSPELLDRARRLAEAMAAKDKAKAEGGTA